MMYTTIFVLDIGELHVCVCGFVVLAYPAMVMLLEKVEVVKPQGMISLYY